MANFGCINSGILSSRAHGYEICHFYMNFVSLNLHLNICM